MLIHKVALATGQETIKRVRDLVYCDNIRCTIQLSQDYTKFNNFMQETTKVQQRSSNQAALCLPISHTRRRLHTVAFYC